MPDDVTNVQTPTESAGTDAGADTVLAAADVGGEDGQPGGDQAASDSAQSGDDKGDKGKDKGTPEKYEFTLAEGMTLDQGMVDKFTPAFKELGLTNEQAQKLVSLYADTAAEQNKSAEAKTQKFFAEMKAETLKIPKAEIGLAKSTLLKFGKEGQAVLNDVYMGSNPDMVRFLAKLGKLIGDATFHEGDGPSPANDDQARLGRLYPSMNR